MGQRLGIKCKFCGDIIVSLSRHDFKFCKCGKVAIDGGQDYLKTSFPADMKPDDCYEVVTVASQEGKV